jgi:UDP:flavonoid glycosyltransferase YjiC (YdhE family)
MRVLFASTHGAGHFGPQVPFAAALARAGHDVIVAVPAGAVEMVEAAGFEAWPLDDPPDAAWAAVSERLPTLSWEEQNALVIGQIFGDVDTRASLPRMLEAFAAWQPDVVLRDTAEFASALVAELRGVPHMRVAVGLGMTEEWGRPFAAPAVDAIGRELGLAADPALERIARTPYLTVVPPTLEDPEAASPADVHRFRETESATEPFDPGPGDPLVYVSFGSVAARIGFFPGVYRAVINALEGLPARVLVTIGQAHAPQELGPVPDGVRVERWVPQREVMTATAVMVGHGGFGSMMRALQAGVPQVLVPLFADQPLNARRVAAVGAGVALNGGPAAIGELRDAVEGLLTNGTARAAAGRVADDIAALPPVHEVEALLTRG